MPNSALLTRLAARSGLTLSDLHYADLDQPGDLDADLEAILLCLRDGRDALIRPRPWDMMPMNVAAWLCERNVPSKSAVQVWEAPESDAEPWSGTLGQVGRGSNSPRAA